MIRTYNLQTYHLTELLKLKEVSNLFDQAVISRSANKLIYQLGEQSYVFIYRFGSVGFFNVPKLEQERIINTINEFLVKQDRGPHYFAPTDEMLVEVDRDQNEEVAFEKTVLNELSFGRLEVLALILAQSTALEYFELKVDKIMEQSTKLVVDMRDRGRLRTSDKKVNQIVGFCMTTKQDIVVMMYLLDKPEETWHDEALDKLYLEAVDMYELKERYRTIDHKLRMMQENLSLIADFVSNRRAAWLELTIIVLILVEVVLFVYDLWLV
ncbi:MAG: RMD1 family protein [Pseudomonadota bacterium]